MYFHISTPVRSIHLGMKKQSRDLVASAGHLCQSKVCLSTKLRSESFVAVAAAIASCSV